VQVRPLHQIIYSIAARRKNMQMKHLNEIAEKFQEVMDMANRIME